VGLVKKLATLNKGITHFSITDIVYPVYVWYALDTSHYIFLLDFCCFCLLIIQLAWRFKAIQIQGNFIWLRLVREIDS
jgi:hypothetical protein